MSEEIQRAEFELFAKELAELRNEVATIVKGCHVLVDTDTVLNQRLNTAKERIDMVNKRLRRLEVLTEKYLGEPK